MKLLNLIPKKLQRRPTPPRRPVQTQLDAATAAASRRGEALDDYDGPEQTTSLSTAFFIVLALHVVAIVGIYIFNHLKATRRPSEPVIAAESAKKTKLPAAKSAPPVAKTAPVEPRVAPEKPVATAPPAQARVLPSGARIHRVVTGDNLTKIATQYAVTVADLEDANNLDSKAVLKVDQILNIPGQKNVTRQAPPIVTAKLDTTPKKPAETAPTKASAPVTKTYVVKKDDTATSIAKTYGVSAAELLKLNAITDPKKLQPGKTLKVPAKKN